MISFPSSIKGWICALRPETSFWSVPLLGEIWPVEGREQRWVGRECGGDERVATREEKTLGPSQSPGMKTMVGLVMAGLGIWVGILRSSIHRKTLTRQLGSLHIYCLISVIALFLIPIFLL